MADLTGAADGDDALEVAMRSLSVEDRQLIWLAVVEQQSPAEIGRLLDLGEEIVTRQLAAAAAAFRAAAFAHVVPA